MKEQTDLAQQKKPDITSAPIATVAFGLGVLGLIPSLLILFILCAVSFHGVRFVWRLLQLLG